MNEDLNKMKKYADEHGITISEFTRKAIDDELNNIEVKHE